MAVSDVVARPVRSAAQGSVAWIAVELVDSFFYNLDERQYGVLVAALTVVFGWVQVLVENKVGVGFFRKPEPPPRQLEPVEADPAKNLPQDVRDNAVDMEAHRARHEKPGVLPDENGL